MPNRIIKENIRTSRSVNEMNDFQFRLWVYLITYVDDYGRGSADPELLKGFVFPRRKSVTESAIAKGLTDLAAMGLVNLYEVGGESYLCFPTWAKHQRIQNKKSKFPEPDEESQIYTVTHGESQPESESNPNPNPNSNPKDSVPRKRFTPPTLEELTQFIQENGLGVDPQSFLDYYESNGWKVGTNRMKDWKATARNWDRREFPKKTGKQSQPVGSAGQAPLGDLEREAVRRMLEGTDGN